MLVLDHRLLLAQDYALINPLQVDSSLWRDLPLRQVLPTGVAAAAALMPRLLPLREIPENDRLSLLDRVATQRRRSKHPYFSALFKSSRDAVEVTTKLENKMIVHSTGNRKAILRFPDPRVFRHLTWILTEAQMGSLLSCASIWTWPKSARHWSQYHRPSVPWPSRLRVTNEQWDALQRMRMLNRCLERLATETPGATSDDAVIQQVDVYLEAAYTKHGLQDDEDRILLTLQALRFHPKISEHPEITKRLAIARGGTTSYVRACANLTDDELSVVAKKLFNSAPLKPPARMPS